MKVFVVMQCRPGLSPPVATASNGMAYPRRVEKTRASIGEGHHEGGRPPDTVADAPSACMWLAGWLAGLGALWGTRQKLSRVVGFPFAIMIASPDLVLYLMHSVFLTFPYRSSTACDMSICEPAARDQLLRWGNQLPGPPGPPGPPLQCSMCESLGRPSVTCNTRPRYRGSLQAFGNVRQHWPRVTCLSLYGVLTRDSTSSRPIQGPSSPKRQYPAMVRGAHDLSRPAIMPRCEHARRRGGQCLTDNEQPGSMSSVGAFDHSRPSISSSI